MVNNILNIDYYKSLVQKYSVNVEFNSSLLPISRFNKLNLSFIKRALSESSGYDLILSIPTSHDFLLKELYSNIYLFIANKQFYDNYINPDLTSLKYLIPRIGKKNRKYKVYHISDNLITLIEDKKEKLNDLNGPAKIFTNRKNIIRQFVPVERSVKKSSVNKYFQLFGELNELDIKKDFFPTKFGSVSIFIGSKKILDSFRNISVLENNLWNSIPCYYINREGEENDTMGIEPLLYFVSSYRIAYEKIVQKKKINNIVLFNDGFNELQQIVNDQFQYRFRILGISESKIEKRVNTINYWEWHKEEINLIESL